MRDFRGNKVLTILKNIWNDKKKQREWKKKNKHSNNQ